MKNQIYAVGGIWFKIMFFFYLITLFCEMYYDFELIILITSKVMNDKIINTMKVLLDYSLILWWM